jgi:GntR family transcriptional regulator
MLLQLNFSSNVPIYMQIRNQIIMGIADGQLPPGEKLPTIRSLADESGINMMTVNKAYQLLKQEGYITADRRSGAIVVGGVSISGPHINDMSEESISELKLFVSEAKLKGISKELFLQLTGRLYDELEVY